ncbi:MAG: cytochrome c oxidase subunit II [Chloroflexota bacterium]|nr:cytochrome c oxidase subunit II [Chloroflexota bacterium]
MSEANIEGNTGGASPVRKEPDHIRRVLTIWVVLSIVGIIVWGILSPFLLPTPASDVDSAANFTLVVFTDLAIPVALFVFVFLSYSMLVFRVKERPTEDAIPLKPRPGLQIGWMGVTGALCLFLVIWGMFAFYQQTASAAINPLVVQVTGQQWDWTFNYPQYGASSQGQLIELPVNRPVEFDVTSKDVLHGFAIRALGIRVDANPGEVTTTPLATPTRIGQYSVVCVELCGLYHSYMWSSVNVVSDSDFSSWIVSQGGHP